MKLIKKRSDIFLKVFRSWLKKPSSRELTSEVTNTMRSRMHLHKEKEEEDVTSEFKKEKNFTGGKRKIGGKKC